MKSRLVTFSAWSSGLNDRLASGNPLLNQVFKILPCAEAAFPRQAFKLRCGEAARRCLACNTYVNEMRSGAKLGCVVNGMTAGRVPLDAPA
jgi:hypothetical protein